MMWRNVRVNLSDLLFSASEVMDLSDASLVDHQMRTAYAALEMAEAARLDYAQCERLFVAALLHDIGALSPEEKVGAHIFEDVNPDPHCQRGAKLFREAFWLEPSAEIVAWHHTPMKSHAAQGRGISQPNVLASQIVFLADHLERGIDRGQFILHQAEELRGRIRELEGRQIHADVVALFERVSSNDGFWLELVSKDLGQRLREQNLLRSIHVDYEAASSIAGVFKDITDFRSRFTAMHSSGVSVCALGISSLMGFTGKDQQQIKLAALMHDMGKLVVPNAILCKADRLTEPEMSIVRQHAYYTYRILSRVRGMEQIAEWAGFHHERMNGSGYFQRLERMDLDLGSKIIAVADVAMAIAEMRPYRAAGDRKTVIYELREMVRREQLEGQVVQALLDEFDPIMRAAAEAQAADETRFRTRYEMV